MKNFTILSLSILCTPLFAFVSTRRPTLRQRYLHSSTVPREPTSPILDDITEDFKPLFAATINATALRKAKNEDGAHDSFRFEWGTWVEEESLDWLKEKVDEVRLKKGVFDKIVEITDSRRFRIAGGKSWDCLLHVLPEGETYQGRWPTGSWSMVKTLIGMAEIASLVENRDGQLRKRTTKSLRGGSDGSIAGGQSSGGAPCVKYVGGPLRSYSGKYGKTVILEVTVRPPIGKEDEDPEIIDDLPMDVEDVLSIFVETEDDSEPEESEKIDIRNATHLGSKMGMSFDQVGGLDKQLDAIARRVLASRANPAAARRLGISHVRGLLLSGPPGCGKTLLARELARILGAREPQIVNGPEILDKYIGEAEKKVRELFAPAEEEYKISGDDSALHIIILDEMDAIARKRGTMTSDTTGVRDSVVNQLLAKMDGVNQAPNILVVGLTNRPELLDPALLRPGRLEIQLRVELPDKSGRRDILRIHTRRMREDNALTKEATEFLEDMGDKGAPGLTEYFSGAELAGLVRSAASFALARSIEGDQDGIVTADDIREALTEVRPALGKQDEELKSRFPLGISPCSSSMERIVRELTRFTAPLQTDAARLHSMLLVGGGSVGGSGVTALASWAAAEASVKGNCNYVRFVSALDLLGVGEGGEEGRAAALVDKFSEASEMSNALLVLDDVDQLCAGTGKDGYSTVMLATLRALLRQPPATKATAKAGGHSESRAGGRSFHIIATSSRTDAACDALHEIFEETVVVPQLQATDEVDRLLRDCFPSVYDPKIMAETIIDRVGPLGCKTALRLAERAVSISSSAKEQVPSLERIIDDLSIDEASANGLCRVR